MDSTVILGVVMFTATVLTLVGVILFARARLVSTGDVTIFINDDPDKSVTVPAGGKLLGTLASKGILSRVCLRRRRHLRSMPVPGDGRRRQNQMGFLESAPSQAPGIIFWEA